MPLPALAGIGWLGSLIGGLFAALVGFLLKFLTQRFAIVVALIAAGIAATGLFYVAISGVIVLISPITPPQLDTALGLVMPSNFRACVSAYLSAYVLRWLYDWQIKVLTMTNQGSGF